MGKYIQNLQGTKGPKGKTGHNLVLGRQVVEVKNPAGFHKRGPLGPQLSYHVAIVCGIYIYTGCQIQVTMYICTYWKGHKLNICTFIQWEGPCPPPVYFWGATLYTFLQDGVVGQHVPLDFFCPWPFSRLLTTWCTH